MKLWKKILKWTGIVIGVILLLLIILPLVIPVPALKNVVSPDQLADKDSQFIQINGIRVHYKMVGQGEPFIILLHGFGASVFSWREVMHPLSPFGTVIAYDRPAFGLTERPTQWTGINPYSLDSDIAMLIGLMDAMHIQQAIVVGNSAGGRVAVAAALKYPERIQGLVLVDAAVYGNMSSPWRSFLYNLPQVNRWGPFFVRSIASSGDDTIRQAWHDPSKITADVYAGYHKPLQAENWDRALWEFTKAADNTDLASHLAELKMPVMVVAGDDDRIIPTEKSLQLAKDIPNAELTVFKDCGHVPQEECPQQFLSTVSRFIVQFIKE